MDRRAFNKLVGLAAVGALSTDPALEKLNAEQGTSPESARASSDQGSPSASDGDQRIWKSGQGSPVHDCDRLYPIGPKSIVLENDQLSLRFDQRTGALVAFTSKATGWSWQTRPELGESFDLFVPTPERHYNPVLGVRNRLTSFHKFADSGRLDLIWSHLKSEYLGRLDVTLRGAVHLKEGEVRFEMAVENRSPYTIASLSWPILGSLSKPDVDMRVFVSSYGSLYNYPIWSHAGQYTGYFGTNYPTTIINKRYILAAAGNEGLYAGAHNPKAREDVRFFFEVKPGPENSYTNANSHGLTISGHPVRLTMRMAHFPFFNSGESGSLAPILLSPYSGDWHSGVDVYKRWLKTWYRPMPAPSWANGVQAWQQLQINSSEDDLRTRYIDIPRRVAQDAAHGITALQLTGWNKGGQDRGNPTCDTDPRLGTTAELKEAIAQIQKMGVRVILFAKYAWADATTEDYKATLHKCMATDPYGEVYKWAGFRYQTPEQLAGINPRNLAAGCTNYAEWRKILAGEFEKVIALAPDGVLFDEAQGGKDAGFSECFNPNHGHHVPATIWSGDIVLSRMYRGIVRNSVGETNFLFSGEDPEDVIAGAYTLTYFRITKGHVPNQRYAFPFRPIMIAVTGFNDREMINRALMYRYILSYEPFNFKGNIGDFPLTMAYGQLVDGLRKRYKDYLWDAEFRDTLEAAVSVDAKRWPDYSVFKKNDGRRAVVIINPNPQKPIEATIAFEQPGGRRVKCASPEKPVGASCGASVNVPPRSAVVVMEQ